jgi:hypothetical protein
MATQEELNQLNKESIERQRESLADSRLRRDLRRQRDEALSGATSTRERREIKSAYEDNFYDNTASASPQEEPRNQTLYAEEPPMSTSGGGGGGGGGSLADTYTETDAILCQNGSPVSGKILFKAD